MELCLAGKSGEAIRISALSFDTICSPLPTEVCLDQHSLLQELDLADYVSDCESCENIDVLIGSDYYWDVVTGVILCGDSKLVVVRSKFGWLVSGPVKNAWDSCNFATSNLIIERPCDFIYNQVQPEELADSLKWFWDVESVGITENSDRFLDNEQFLKGINFDQCQGERAELEPVN